MSQGHAMVGSYCAQSPQKPLAPKTDTHGSGALRGQQAGLLGVESEQAEETR